MANAELKKYIVEKIYTNGEFVRMLYLCDYYGQPQEKKGIEKRHPGLKPKCQTRLHLWR